MEFYLISVALCKGSPWCNECTGTQSCHFLFYSFYFLQGFFCAKPASWKKALFTFVRIDKSYLLDKQRLEMWHWPDIWFSACKSKRRVKTHRMRIYEEEAAQAWANTLNKICPQMQKMLLEIRNKHHHCIDCAIVAVCLCQLTATFILCWIWTTAWSKMVAFPSVSYSLENLWVDCSRVWQSARFSSGSGVPGPPSSPVSPVVRPRPLAALAPSGAARPNSAQGAFGVLAWFLIIKNNYTDID